MVSGYPKSIEIPWVDGLSTGPPGFGASHELGTKDEVFDISKLFLKKITKISRKMKIKLKLVRHSHVSMHINNVAVTDCDIVIFLS